jgi:hypothetical protein
MKLHGMLKSLCVGAACIGLILSTPVLEAASPPVTRGDRTDVQPRNSVDDVKLDRAGYFHGLAVDAQGAPAAGAEVVLRQLGREAARARTDAAGRFRAGPVRGGMYQVSVGEHGRLVRAWAASTAPPASKRVALLVAGSDVVRGQMPLEQFFASDTVIIAGLVAAMIAIPIAVHNSGPRTP